MYVMTTLALVLIPAVSMLDPSAFHKGAERLGSSVMGVVRTGAGPVPSRRFKRVHVTRPARH
jgi:hypothetical protein